MRKLTNKMTQVIVIGAGAAGLYTAYLLDQYQIDFQILEAANRYGGRIRLLKDFSDFPVELGAEEVHGEKSSWYDFIVNLNQQFVKEKSEDYFFVEGELKTESEIEEDSRYKEAEQLLDEIKNYQGPDITVKDFIQEKEIDPCFYPLLNAQIGNELGASNKKVGIASLAAMLKKWTAGDKSFFLKKASFQEIIDIQFASILDKVQLDTQIKTIDYSQDRIEIIDQKGMKHSAEKVVLTVPLTILQNEDIIFKPSLSNAKLTAIQNIKMDFGLKIVLKFSSPFWAKNTGSIYSSGYIPEFWATGFGKSKENNVLTAFVMGEKAKYLSEQGKEVIAIALEELDEIYGKKVASKSFVDGVLMDWSKEPFIRGAYSYPSPGSEESREALAASVENKVFFAGEATNFNGHYGSVHGAIETGARVVNELLSSLKRARS